MLSQNLRQLIRPLVIIQQVIWAVITGSIVFYFGIIYVLVGSHGSRSVLTNSIFETFFYAAALVLAVSSLYLRRYFLSDNRLKRAMSKDVDLHDLASDPRTKKTDSEKLEQLKSLSDFERRVYSLMYYLQKITFINLFMNEIVVILGFVLAFLSGDASKIIPFGAGSLVLSLWMYPRSGKITERASYLHYGETGIPR